MIRKKEMMPQDERDTEKKKKKKDKPVKVEVDIDGIQERIIAFPIPEKNYFQIAAVKDGLIYSREAGKGSLHHWYWDAHPSDESLERFDFNTQKTESITKKVSNFKVGMNGRTLIYRAGKKLYLSSDLFEEHPGHQNVKDAGMNPNRKSDWLDLGSCES
jgi:tricorn protease